MGSTSETSTPARKLYVLIPPSALFAVHWSFFLPELLAYDTVTRRHEESSQGRRIHVSGDRLNGFELEIIRNYDVKKHRSVGTRYFPIGIIQSFHLNLCRDAKRSGDHVNKDDDEGGGWIDNEPIDDFERAVVGTEPPGPSLNRVVAGEQGGKRKMQVKDCQWWVKEVVRALVEGGILESAGTAEPCEVAATLPVH